MATVLRDPLPSSSPFLLHSIFSSIFSLLPFSFLPLYFPSFAPFLSIRPPSFNRAPPSIHPSVPFAPFFLRSRTLNLLELFSFFFSFSLSLSFFLFRTEVVSLVSLLSVQNSIIVGCFYRGNLRKIRFESLAMILFLVQTKLRIKRT